MSKAQKAIIVFCLSLIFLFELRVLWVYHIINNNKLAYISALEDYKIYSTNGLEALKLHMQNAHKLRKKILLKLIENKAAEEIKGILEDEKESYKTVYDFNMRPMQEQVMVMHLAAIFCIIFFGEIFLLTKRRKS